MGARPSRLSFPVKVLGREELKSNDARRAANSSHLKVSIEYVDAILDYLAANELNMYRMSSDLAPYATHPDMPQFHLMVTDSRSELRSLGKKSKALDIRLSFHPSQFVVLNSQTLNWSVRALWTSPARQKCLTIWSLGQRPCWLSM